MTVGSSSSALHLVFELLLPWLDVLREGDLRPLEARGGGGERGVTGAYIGEAGGWTGA